MNYIHIFDKMQIQLLQPLKQVKEYHQMRCMVCNHSWSATPISKVHNFIKKGIRGCPNCYSSNRNIIEKEVFIQKIKDRGFEILDDYNGNQNQMIKFKVRNTTCGHEFEVLPRNIISRNVKCPTCNTKRKREAFQQFNIDRHNKFQITATDWQAYKHKVYMLTRSAYRKHKMTINPLNLPRGLAGCEGAYHLDHIKSVQSCFEGFVPAEQCGHYTNLQMLPWLNNIVKR